jgi:hypothetical protein
VRHGIVIKKVYDAVCYSFVRVISFHTTFLFALLLSLSFFCPTVAYLIIIYKKTKSRKGTANPSGRLH